MSTKIIDFYESINQISINKLIEEVKAIKEDSIVIVITSPGGNPNAVTTFEKFLKDNKLSITTVGMQKVASAAVTLFLLGDKRILFPGSLIMMHEPKVILDTYSVTSSSIINISKQLKEANEITFHNLFAKTHVTEDMLYQKISGKNWIICPEEAYRLGIATSLDYKEDV